MKLSGSIKKYLPHAVFAAIVLAIMLPLYRRGFIFALDMVFSPHLNLANYIKNDAVPTDFPIIALIKALSFILPVDLIQKIILSLILFLAGFLMCRLAEKFLPRKWAILSGVFYLFNPYVYERFLAGQWYVLMGYAFFPLLIKLFLEFLEKVDRRSFAKFALVFSVYPIFSLHWAYIAFWFLLVLGIIDRLIVKNRILSGRKLFSLDVAKKYIAFFLIGAACFLAINSFWLLSLRNPSNVYHAIGSNDFEAFRTQSDKTFGVFFNVLSLYGFWGNEHFSVKDFSPYWWILTFVMVFFAFLGVCRFFRGIEREEGKSDTGKSLILTLSVIFIPIVFLAVGYGSEITKPLIDFLYNFVPGFKGMRETEKLVGLLAFSYAVLIPIGGLVLSRRQKYIFWLIALVPFFSSYTMFWGFSGQLKAQDYPASWYEADRILTEDKSNKLLFLPWHGYPSISFAENYRISNPASKFFQVPVVAGKNIENAYIAEDTQEVWNKKMFQLLQGFETLDENIDFLSDEGITYIALAKEADYKRYGFLERSAKIKKILDSKEIVLYKIQ